MGDGAANAEADKLAIAQAISGSALSRFGEGDADRQGLDHVKDRVQAWEKESEFHQPCSLRLLTTITSTRSMPMPEPVLARYIWFHRIAGATAGLPTRTSAGWTSTAGKRRSTNT